MKDKSSLSKTALEEAAECLRVIAHPVRLQMIESLLRERSSVGELAMYCGIPPNVASTHLKLLERCGFLRAQRDGRVVYYEVIEDHLQDLMRCIQRRFSESVRR